MNNLRLINRKISRYFYFVSYFLCTRGDKQCTPRNSEFILKHELNNLDKIREIETIIHERYLQEGYDLTPIILNYQLLRVEYEEQES